jgi:flagellar basal-body rod protein FlgB
VGAINDAAIVAALRRQMTVASARQVVAAGNIANVDTPGFKAKTIDFDKVLDAELQAGARLVSTNARHLPRVVANDAGVVEAQGLQARRDGNTVQVDRELLSMTKASGDFAAAQTALAAKFRLVRYALSEAK